MPSLPASATSSHLRTLLAQLEVDEAASRARRDGGGNTDERLEDTEDGASRTGTSPRSSVLVGVPFTVVSGLGMDLDEADLSGSETRSPTTRQSRAVPLSVRLQLPKHVGPARTFSVTRLPHDVDAFSLLCRATVGKSGTFCISRNCTINHQGPVAQIKPGTLVVVKVTGKTAFLSPVVKSNLLDQALLGDWLSTQETLESWTTKFDQVLGSSAFVTRVNAAALEVTRDEERRAANFKTPRTKKRRSIDVDTIERIGISPYARVLLNGQEEFEVMSPEEKLEKLTQMVIDLDTGVDQLGSFYVTLGQDMENASNAQSLTNQMLEHKINLIRRTLGTKPDHLKDEIEAPTVWGGMSALLGKTEVLEMLSTGIGQKDPPKADPDWSKRVSTLEADLLATAATLMKSLQTQGHRIDAIQNAGISTPTATAPLDSRSIQSLKEEVQELRAEIKRMNAENKPHVVKFGGLNLDSLSNATAWISLHVAVEDVGLVVDPHTVFEHIFANLSGREFLKNFERVHKLEISTLAQGYSMSSFEQPIPKIFSKAGTTVIKDDSSYLSRIVSWDDWDYPDTGLRQCLTKELVIFNRSHRSEIENTLDEESRVYAVACLALSDSVSIIEAIIKFIDDFVKHLTTAKFSVKKAFHVTSRLVKRIFTEMFEPRQGILKSFKTRNLEQTSAAIFWANLRSLDIGMGFKRTGLENLHIVSSELVKFLLVNTGYESISGLEAKVKLLETQSSELQKLAKNSEKSALSAGNKADEMKKICEALAKRLAKVETKVT
jgi:hypothetical protein